MNILKYYLSEWILSLTWPCLGRHLLRKTTWLPRSYTSTSRRTWMQLWPRCTNSFRPNSYLPQQCWPIKKKKINAKAIIKIRVFFHLFPHLDTKVFHFMSETVLDAWDGGFTHYIRWPENQNFILSTMFHFLNLVFTSTGQSFWPLCLLWSPPDPGSFVSGVGKLAFL